MNAMCTVKNNDVLNCVKEMLRVGYNGDLIQTSGPKYTHLDNNRSDAPYMANRVSKQFDYIIDLEAETVHAANCDKCGRERIRARLINLKSTGLKICKCLNKKSGKPKK